MPNTRCLRLNLTSLVCALVVCATTSIAQSQENQLPETAQGRVISSYLAAYNSGSSETMATFNQAYRTAEALARRSPKEHDDMYKRIRSQFGDVTFHSVADLTDDQITIVIENDNQQWFDMTFTFKGDDQPLIESIQLRGPVSEPGQTIDQALVESTIEGVLEALNTTYVFPEVAAEMEKAVRAKAEAGRYDDVTDAGDLAEMLTEDLREVCHDLHLSVRAGSRPGGPNPTPEQRAERMAQDRERNFYFDEPQILEGNIGYIKFDGFHGSDEAHEVVAKFMEQVLDTDALIFDVRANGGGSPNMIMFLSSYLFDEPVHLNSFYNRHTDETQHFWSKAEVPGGVKYGEVKPVYVLTSSRTFSAAEEFTYNLRNLERATIVGEQTGGGAHPIRTAVINDQFYMSVPYARAVNPITKTNWEGVGVEPHIKTNRDDALDTAHIDALKTLIEKSDTTAKRMEAWEQALMSLEKDS